VRLIGLAGGSASGKTTVARHLTRALGDRCLVVPHDWYYLSFHGDTTTHNFDHPSALDTPMLVEALDRLRAGESTVAPDYDFPTHTRRGRSEWHALSPRPVVLVEGILVLADAELRRRFDLRVYVHAPGPLRLERRLARDVASRGRTADEILAQYHDTVLPMHERYVEPSRAHADLVLDGTQDPAGLARTLLDRIG
jgi:uridine kinase